MSPHMSSPRLMPTWSPSLWVACMVLMFGRLQALVPSEATPPRRSEEQHGPGDTPLFPGVPSTPLTTTSERACNTQLSKHTALARYDIKGFGLCLTHHVQLSPNAFLGTVSVLLTCFQGVTHSFFVAMDTK